MLKIYRLLPKGAQHLTEVINSRRMLVTGINVEFVTRTLKVPKQKGGADCGLFLLENVSRILDNPEHFFVQAAEDDLACWYHPNEVVGMREELATLLKQLGEEQRDVGGLLVSLNQLFSSKLACN